MAADLRVMVDANVLVAGITYPRFPYEVLRHAVLGDYTLVLSPLIIQEARIAIERIAPDFTGAFDEFIETLLFEQVGTPTPEAIEQNIHLIRDPKDVHVALAAISAQVDLLITQDRDFTDVDEHNQQFHELIKVMLPGTFLRQYMGWESKGLEDIRRRNWRDTY